MALSGVSQTWAGIIWKGSVSRQLYCDGVNLPELYRNQSMNRGCIIMQEIMDELAQIRDKISDIMVRL